MLDTVTGGEQGQRLLLDQRAATRRLLVRLERRRVLEDLEEQELCRVIGALGDRQTLEAGLLPSSGGEAVDDPFGGVDLAGLNVPGNGEAELAGLW